MIETSKHGKKIMQPFLSYLPPDLYAIYALSRGWQINQGILYLFLLEFCMLRQDVFGCNRVEIWPNSFDLDFSMPYSKFHTFLHLKAYGGALLCMEKIYMSCYVLLCLSNILSNFGSLSKNSLVSHIINLNAFCTGMVLKARNTSDKATF